MSLVLKKSLLDELRRKRAASLTGYGLLIGLIGVTAISAVNSLGEEVEEIFGVTSTKLDDAASGSSGGELAATEPASILAPPSLIVDSSADTVADDGVTTFREAIGLIADGTEPSGSVIGFDSSISTITLSSPIELTSGAKHYPVTAGTGNTVTISGGDSTHLFRVSGGAELTMENMVLTEGHWTGGAYGAGAIYAAGPGTTVTLSNVSVTNNYSNYYGAGLYLSNGASLTMTGGEISNNYSYYGGAAAELYPSANLTLTNVTVNGNTAQYSAGITAFAGSVVTLDGGTEITNNVGSVGGIGGVRVAFSKIYADDVTISGNTGKFAGGMYLRGVDAPSSISNATITNNQGGGGGGIRIGSDSVLTISNSTISNNDGQNPIDTSPKHWGGGIYILSGAVVDIENSYIENNTALQGGGGMAVFGGSGVDVTITNTKIRNNTASGYGSHTTGGDGRTNGPHNSGGGIYISTGGVVTINNSEISGNTAGGYGSFDESAPNSADYDGGGGGINIGSASNGVFLNNSTVSGNNVTQGWGCGILVRDNSVLTVTNSDVTGNGTTGNCDRGGGIMLSNTGAVDPTLTVSGSATEISNNRSTDRGGGIFIDNSADSVDIDDASISGNTAGSGSGKGGGIYTLNSMTVDNVTFNSNDAGASGDGGAIYAAGAGTSVTGAGNSFSGNNPTDTDTDGSATISLTP